MRTLILAAISALTLTTSLSTLTTAGSAIEVGDRSSQIAQRTVNTNEATDACTDAAEGRGLQVREIVSIEPFSGGAEVRMRVGQRRGDTSLVGCDYSNGTRQVQLYRLEGEDSSGSQYNNDSSDWRRAYSSQGVRDRSQAEDIARQVVGEQLNIQNPDSDIVQIDDIDRSQGDRNWEVKGRVNGAAFVMQIRANDGYIVDFQLY